MSTSEEQRRFPGAGTILGLILLAASIGGVSWWTNGTQRESPVTGPALPELDVVCLGRVDGLNAVVNLDAPMPGKVAEVFVEEGRKVGAKEKLLRLDDESLKLRVEEAQAAVGAADIEIAAAKLEEKLHPIRKSSLETAVKVAAERVAVAKQVFKEKETARGFGTITAVELLAAQSEVKQLEQLESVEKSRLEELELAEPGLKVRAAQTKLIAAQVALKQAQKAVSDCVLLAPMAGTVLRVQASIGEMVAPGTLQPPIMFRPDGPVVVRAELEQEFLGRVKSGMKAVIRDDARSDSPLWNGRVRSVGQVVARKRLILLEPGELNDVRTVECVIDISGDTTGLLVGQRMRVRISRAD
jgi:multidrug resistance efflux pump